MIKSIQRARIEIEDWLRWNSTTRGILERRILRKARRQTSRDSHAILNTVNQLCAAARLAPDTAAMQDVEKEIDRNLALLDFSKVDWREWIPNVDERKIETSVILKPRVSAREKGVLFVAFDDQWARMLWKCNLEQFAKDYTLVISPTWSPPHHLINSVFPAAYPGPVFCLISNTNDLAILPRLSKRYVPVPLLASSWVNPAIYKPVPFEKKDVDIYMLANFAKYKRHFLLFKALRDMPKSVRVVLCGQENRGRGEAQIMAEAAAYGVQDRFKLRVNAPDSEVLDLMSRAKTALILTRREGSCVAVAEYMFANTPAGLFEDAEVGSRAFINSSTGRFLSYRNLGAQLMDFIGNAGKYAPRAWAVDNISCFQSTQVLNKMLRTHALAEGQDWTQDIAVHHWRPYPELVDESDRPRMQPAYDDLQSRFGFTLGVHPAPKKVQEQEALAHSALHASERPAVGV